MTLVRKFICTIFVGLLLSPLIHAQALFSRDADSLQTAAVATGNGTALTVRGYGGAIIQVTGTFSATLIVEGTVDGTNWVTLRVMNVSDGSFVTSVTATGVYAIATAGIETIRARVSAYTSGSVTVKGRGSVAVIARANAGNSIGSTAILGGTNGYVLYDNAGVIGEYPITGTGNAVLSISPTLTGTVGVAAATFSGSITVGGGTPILKHLSATAALDFANQVAAGCEVLTITVTGAAVGDTVAIGVPNASDTTTSTFYGWVSAADTVSVKHCAIISGNPASGTFRADVWQH